MALLGAFWLPSRHSLGPGLFRLAQRAAPTWGVMVSPRAIRRDRTGTRDMMTAETHPGTERRGSELPLAAARLEDEAGAMRGAVALGQEPVPAHYPLTAAQPL